MTLPISTAVVVERFYAGESVETLARAFNCHRNTILYRLNQAGARTRVRARTNARVMLTAHRPVLLGLLSQLERTIVAVRKDFALVDQIPEERRRYLDRIARLEDQIQALRTITAALPARVGTGKQVNPCCSPS